VEELVSRFVRPFHLVERGLVESIAPPKHVDELQPDRQRRSSLLDETQDALRFSAERRVGAFGSKLYDMKADRQAAEGPSDLGEPRVLRVRRLREPGHGYHKGKYEKPLCSHSRPPLTHSFGDDGAAHVPRSEPVSSGRAGFAAVRKRSGSVAFRRAARKRDATVRRRHPLEWARRMHRPLVMRATFPLTIALLCAAAAMGCANKQPSTSAPTLTAANAPGPTDNVSPNPADSQQFKPSMAIPAPPGALLLGSATVMEVRAFPEQQVAAGQQQGEMAVGAQATDRAYATDLSYDDAVSFYNDTFKAKNFATTGHEVNENGTFWAVRSPDGTVAKVAVRRTTPTTIEIVSSEKAATESTQKP
jgi:hypothetical protein